MEYKITQEILQSVVNYLQARPFGEVYRLVNILLELPKVEEVVKADKK